jgi:transposase
LDFQYDRHWVSHGDSSENRRWPDLHVWPYGKIVNRIEYKAGLYEMIKISEAYSSRTCHGCSEVRRTSGNILV